VERTILAVFAAVCAASCGGSAAAPQLVTGPGQVRADVSQLMRGHDYCSLSEAEHPTERFERCERPGLDVETSWADVEYGSDDRAKRIVRYERWPDTDTAAERWNKLVEEKTSAFGAPSEDAKHRLAEMGETPSGALRWAAWFGRSGEVVVGVYLAEESGEQPIIQEVIRYSVAIEE